MTTVALIVYMLHMKCNTCYVIIGALLLTPAGAAGRQSAIRLPHVDRPPALDDYIGGEPGQAELRRDAFRQRDPHDGELYSSTNAPTKDWMILREFYCPRCASLLDVENVPQGYPFIFNFLPDFDDEPA